MSQISPPIRIVLVFAVVVLAAWFTILKPKEELVAPVATAPPAAGAAAATPAAPTSTAGKFEAKAKQGAAKAEADAYGAANAGIENTGPPTTAVAPTVAAPAGTVDTGTAIPTEAAVAKLPAIDPKALVGLPRSVRDALNRRKVVVLAVLSTQSKPWSETPGDDRAVRKEMRRINRYDGQVVVHSAPIARLSRYDGLLKALNIVQSPTIVVIDHNRKGVALTGFVDRTSINQAIANAHRDSVERELTAPFLRTINENCGYYRMRFERLSVTASSGEVAALAAKRRASFAKVPAPARWRSLKAQIVRAAGKQGAGATALAPLDGRLNAAGLSSCALDRTR